MVVAQFDLRKGGSQNNNKYAYARLATTNGALLNTNVVGTNQISYNNTNNNFSSNTSQFTLIGYDYASNLNTRTYYIQVYSPAGSSHPAIIRNAAIWAIEFTP